MIDKMVERALLSLRANMVEINREQWLKDAVDAEQGGCPLTAASIMCVPGLRSVTVCSEAVIDINVEAEDQIPTWQEDADSFAAQHAVECARAVYVHILKVGITSSSTTTMHV